MISEREPLIAETRTCIIPGDCISVLCDDGYCRTRWLRPGIYEPGQEIPEEIRCVP